MEPEVRGVPSVPDRAHSDTHTKPLKGTFPTKPKVMLTPAEVLFWPINLGQSEMRNIKVTSVPLPGVGEAER